MNNLNEHLDQHPAPAPGDVEQLEVKSKWFSVRLEDINIYTLIALAMIVTSLVLIVAMIVD